MIYAICRFIFFFGMFAGFVATCAALLYFSGIILSKILFVISAWYGKECI